MPAARKKHTATAIDLPVPQSREQAAEQLARIGELARELARIEAGMNDDVARLKANTEAAATPLTDEATRLLGGLLLWATANRDKLTDDGKVKSADLGTGTIGWRAKPANASIRDTEAVLAAIKEKGLTQFIRTKEEVNKEAMIADPALANTIPGVTVKSAGEGFYAEPLALQLSEAAQ